MKLFTEKIIYGIDKRDYRNMGDAERMEASEKAQARELRNEKRRNSYAAKKSQ